MEKNTKQQAMQNAMVEWRKEAIAKVKAAGARIGKAPKNSVLRKWIAAYNIEIRPVPKIKDLSTDESEPIVSTSRKIKSTLQCPTKTKTQIYCDGITIPYVPVKPKESIKPKGYKQKSKKSEIINIETFYDSWAWKDLRYQALKKYGRRCMNCGQQPNKDNKVIIHVDHIKPIRIYPELALDINNLQVLCGDCNQGKGYWDETDFREITKFSVSEESLSYLHEYAQNNFH